MAVMTKERSVGWRVASVALLPLVVLCFLGLSFRYAQTVGEGSYQEALLRSRYARVLQDLDASASRYAAAVEHGQAGIISAEEVADRRHRLIVDAAECEALSALFGGPEQAEVAGLQGAIAVLVALGDAGAVGPADTVSVRAHFDQEVQPRIDARIRDEISEDEAALGRSLDLSARLGNLAMLASLGLVAVGVLLSHRTVRDLVSAIRALEEGALRVSGGDLDVRVDVDRQDELGVLSATFNEMVDSLHRSVVTRAELEQEVVERTAALEATVAELTESRDRMVQAERLAAVGTLAAGVAHEINNPLTFVLSNLEYLAEQLDEGFLQASEPDLQEEVKEVIGEAVHGVERIRRIVGDLRTFSRGGDESTEVVDVHGLIDASVHMVYNQLRQRAHLVREFGAGVCTVRECRLTQVFVNVLMNAIQALPEDTAGSNRIVARTYREADAVVVEIQDNGPGFPPDLIERAFEPFVTTKLAGEGSGLGLAISREVVASVGGSISAEAPPVGGALIRVCLPIVEAPAEADEGTEHLAPERPGRVLLVDDEPLVGASLRRMLRGHDVEVFSDARLALARLREGARYDLVLCDLMMPGFGGMDLFVELRKDQPAVAEGIVFLTGGAFEARAADFLDTCPNLSLRKPIRAEQLRGLLADHMGPSAPCEAGDSG